MRSFSFLKIVCVLGVSSLASYAALSPRKPVFAPPILEIHADSLTDYKLSGASNFQDIQLDHGNRGVRIEGSIQAGPLFPMAFAGNPFESAWSVSGSQNGLRLDTGAYSPQDLDISLPSDGPGWPIGRSYNARQVDSSGTARNSNGPQGHNWFQDSRPELVSYRVNGELGANDDDDLFYLIYRADAFIEFKRIPGSGKTFRATNGAAGALLLNDGIPVTYEFTDMGGVVYTFFGFNTAKAGANGQLWKIEDNNGDVAYVGHETNAATAVTNGFDSAGQITTAFDGSGRRFTYTYTTLDSVDRLTQVKAEVDNGGWEMVGQVDYEYYSTETYGDPGALKLVTITEPQTDAGINIVKNKYYRYWEGTFDDSTNPGHPHAIQYVVDYEGARRFDWSDSTFDEDYLTATENSLKPYAGLYLEYDSNHRVDKAWFNGACGCSGAANGSHEYTYGTNGSYMDNSGYDTAWADRTVVERPDGTYLTQYFDEAHQALGQVTTSSDPSTGSPDTWVRNAVRGSDGLITDVYTPAAVASYTHSTGAITHESAAGLIHSFTRESTGTTKGYVLTRKHKEGSSGTAYLDGSWTYDEATKTVVDTAVVRPFQDKSTAYTERIESGTTGAIDTTMALTFYSGTLAVEKSTTTLPAPSSSKNGSAATSEELVHYQKDGRVDFQKSTTGLVSYSEYAGGKRTLTIADADTTKTGSGEDFETITIPSGFASAGLAIQHKKDEFVYDKQGRSETKIATKGTATDTDKTYFTRLADHRRVVLSFTKTSGSTLYGPVRYTVLNHAGQVEAQGKIALSGNSTTTALTAHIDETDDDPITAVDEGALCALTISLFNDAGQTLEESRRYHDIPVSGAGTNVTNYDRTLFGYDDMGRRTRAKDPTDTIDRTAYDSLGRVTDSYTGTNDSSFTGGESSGTDNMVKTSAREYDSATDGGNNLMTKSIAYVENGTTGQRVTEYTYDYQGRLLLTKNPLAPHSLNDYDNLGRRTATAQYSSTSNITAGTTDPNATGTQTDRLTLNETFYDEQGRVWKTLRHKVDQDDGSLDDNLEALYWFDDAGRRIKMDGLRLTKTIYDRLGRATHQFVLAVDDDTVYADADDVAGDIVLEERQTIFDADEGTVIAVARIDRLHDDYGAGEHLGSLDTNADADHDKFTAANIEGRIQITAFWYDDFERKTEEVDYGTNGGADFDAGSLGSVPARSDTALRTSYFYNDDGKLESIKDPKGIITKYEYNDMGRPVTTIANYDASVSSGNPSGASDNQTVRREYEDGLLKTTTADVPTGGTDQVTTYTYGITVSDSPGPSSFASNRLLREVQYPDKASASDVVRSAYNVQGQATWIQDQAGNVFEMVIDDVGRESHKRVSTLASGFDGAVRRISTTYDDLGRRSLVTQYDNATVGIGSVTDEVRFTYTDWGEIHKFEQDRNSAVDASGSVDDYEVSYLYEKATGGRNTIRRTQLLTPHSKQRNYDYLSTDGLHDDDASRVTRVKRFATELASYDYNGVGHLVGTRYQQADLMSNLYEGSSYTALDRFNRVATSRWTKDLATDIDFVHVDLTYDRNSNITRSVDTVHVDLNATADKPKFDVLYTMDDLNRLTKEEVGEWSGSAIINDQRQQDWTLDQLGNWNVGKLDLNADGDWSDADEYNDDRTHNDVNELTARDTDDDGTNDFSLAYDAVGNLTNDAEAFELTYDPFGRLRKIENQGASAVLAEYVYNGLGFMISELADTDDDGDADANDTWFHTAYDESWRAMCIYREDDASPKMEYIAENAGPDGHGGSSYIDSVLQRRRDTSTAWAAEAGDGTYEEKLFYCQNWRHDVVALVDLRGEAKEWIKYCAYGMPIGLPGGDDNVSGGTDSADLTRIQNRIDGAIGWEYSVLADVDLDGDVRGDDKADVQAGFSGTLLGWGGLSSATNKNRRGMAGAPEHAQGYRIRNRRLTKLGRWSTRDSAGYSADGMSLFAYARCNPVTRIDPDGQQSMSSTGGGGKGAPSVAAPSVNYFSGPGTWTPDPDANEEGGDCCAQYKANSTGMPASSYGRVACCGYVVGTPTPCNFIVPGSDSEQNVKDRFPDRNLQDLAGSGSAAAIIDKCIKVHEKKHISDGISCHTLGNKHRWGAFPHADSDYYEARGYAEEANCFAHAIVDDDCNGNSECFDWLGAMSDHIGEDAP